MAAAQYYYNESWQVVEERNLNDVPTVQYVWDVRYIDAAVVRDRNLNLNDDCTEPATGAGLSSNEGDERVYYCQDANFNVTALVDAYDGVVVERYMYDPYGKPTVLHGVRDANGTSTTEWELRTTSTFKNELLYCGYRYDGDRAGHYHVRYRVYHPTLGRWTARDPIGYEDGLHLYEYCRGMSTQAGDPLGLVSVDLVSDVFWEISLKRRAWSEPEWQEAFRTTNRARFDFDECCSINPLPDSDESQAAFREWVRKAGDWAIWPSDFSGHTKAVYWKATQECECGGKKVDGLFIEAWHAFSTDEAAHVSLTAGLDVEFGVGAGAKAKGVLGGQVVFAPSKELSRTKFVFLACPHRDDTSFWHSIRVVDGPDDFMTHAIHRVGRANYWHGHTARR
jgi:RHS repeat-associated protein